MEDREITRRSWPVAWNGVWVGALAALALALLIGLIGFAVGAHEATRLIDWKKARLASVAFSIGGAFFSFVVGGWAAARVAGIRRSEPAMLHGVIVCLVALPFMVGLAVTGASTHAGAWYGGLAGTPAWATAVSPMDPAVAAGLRNNALAAAGAVLLGLIGAVLGGLMASGEPMSLTHHRRRDRDVRHEMATRTVAPKVSASGGTSWP
jgi:hypothetical protein